MLYYYDSLSYVSVILAIIAILQLSFVIKMSTAVMNNCTESSMTIDPSMCMPHGAGSYCADFLKNIKQYQLNKQLSDLYPCTTGVKWSCTAKPHPHQYPTYPPQPTTYASQPTTYPHQPPTYHHHPPTYPKCKHSWINNMHNKIVQTSYITEA